MLLIRFILILFVARAASSPAWARDKAAADLERSMHVLQANCLTCHSAEKHRGGLRLSSRAEALRGGDNGPVLIPGRAEKSPLWQALQAGADPHMPPKKQLAGPDIETLRRWIAAGARWDNRALARAAAPRVVNLETLPAGYQPVLALAVSLDNGRLAVARGGRLVVHDLTATNFPIVVEGQVDRDAVRSLAWSPDGKAIVIGSFRELTLRKADTLEMVWVVQANLLDRIPAVRFTPAGDKILAADGATAESGWLRIFDSTTGAPLSSWAAHGDTIFDLAISPDGRRAASASADKLVKIWDLESAKETAQLEHAGAVFGLAFNTNASELVTVCADRQFKLWDVATRESVVTVPPRKQAFNAVAWSADGKAVIAADQDGHLVSLSEFKRHTGGQSSETARERTLGSWTEPLHAVALSPDGRRAFAGGQDGIVYAVSLEGKLLATLSPSAIPTVTTKSRPPSFLHDVLPALSKAGCMAGACHAKPEGQNGFKLSVFNYDPKSDYAHIVKEARGRRIFPAAPAESLLLLKPTAAIDHGGGQRFEVGSETYNLLVQWIRGGMIYRHPEEPLLAGIRVEPGAKIYRKGAGQQLRVTARFTDGTTRDVTAQSEFVVNEKDIAQVEENGLLRVGRQSGETVVVTRYLGFVDASRITVPSDRLLAGKKFAALPVNNFIDELSYAHFRKLGLFPSDLCSDAEFLRRSTLDTLGILPTAAEARAFLTSTRPDKRSEWIDHLLAHPAYGDFWANKWADLLRPNPDRVGVKSVFILDQWLREKFRANQPYDQMAREILLAEGNTHRDGPAVIYRDRREPAEIATLFSQIFLGTRMECAKCHHHPNEKWSQDDFYQFAAFFGPLKRKGEGLSPPISGGNETFYFAPGGTVHHPVTDEIMAPRPPDGPALAKTSSDPRQALADWMTSPTNPFFARAAANRVWAAFFGRGLVQPVDDFRISNPATDPELLEALGQNFAANGFDLKKLIKVILSSRIYQLSSAPNEFNRADLRNFSRSYRRRLPAEVLLDAVDDITGVPDDFNGLLPGSRAVESWTYKISSQFMDAFGRPNPSTDCPCERDAHPSVVQSLHMMNARGLQTKLASSTGRAHDLAGSAKSPAEIVEEIYFTVLSRPPGAEELKKAMAAFSAEKSTRQTATEDVMWALLNSAEFVFNH